MKVKQIWVDADACPKVIKEILYRAAERVEIALILVANQPLQVPGSRYIRTVQVGAGFDIADNYIVQQIEPGDLVITVGYSFGCRGDTERVPGVESAG